MQGSSNGMNPINNPNASAQQQINNQMDMDNQIQNQTQRVMPGSK